MLFAVFCPLTLASCVTSGDTPAPLTVALPSGCERVLLPVKVPEPKAGDDARAALARQGAALSTANRRLYQGAECVKDQRKAYAVAK